MSIGRFVRRRGSRVSIYRSTTGQNADGSPSVTWALVKADVAILFEPLTAALAGQVFGATDAIRERGFTATLEDLEAGDGLLVTSGRHVGTRFRVEEILSYDYKSPNAHDEVGLVKTDEVFP